MTWTLLVGLVIALALALSLAAARRSELARMQRLLGERERSLRAGSAEAQLSEPVVDLSRCLGCGTCVRACPEDGVLELVHGQALVVHGARCVGHGACERECPTGAIQVTVKNLAQRRDVPVLDERLEARGAPGLFLAGEVTAHALVRAAIEQGAAVAAEVGRRKSAVPLAPGELDLCIVGAGPAGLACALEARRLGLSFELIDQAAEIGGTVAQYPRRKLVVTRPVELPLFGKLARESYTKEELVELWQSVARQHELPFRGGVRLDAVERRAEGGFDVRTSQGDLRAHQVCLALGRRGSPRRLGVPGEDLPKVATSLLDARSYQGRRILVVGGGDSAVETALGLADQPGNSVTLSYRRAEFVRLRTRNRERFEAARSGRRLEVLAPSRVLAIHTDRVELALEGDAPRAESLANDEVFLMIGGVAATAVLERSGVSFDPALRPRVVAQTERGTGLVGALAVALAGALAALLFALVHLDYYGQPADQRAMSAKDLFLGPGRGAGLALGVAGATLIAVNLLYLVRRSAAFARGWGSLGAWMTSHVATGVLALLCVLLHSAMAPADSLGGHAFWGLAALLATGAIGRYVYAWVPRAASGRELELSEIKLALERDSEVWERTDRDFAAVVRRELEGEIARAQWKSSFLGRLSALFGARRRLARLSSRWSEAGRRAGVSAPRVDELLLFARRAHGTALAAAHYEDLRALLASWRYLHRWLAALVVLLVVLHVVYVLSYGAAWRELPGGIQ